MQRNKLILFIAVLFIILSVSVSQAITVTATPNPATVNQNVSVNITATFLVTPSCIIETNFGDSPPWVDAGICTVSPCSLSTNHTYTTPGTYTITARSKAGICINSPPNPPDPATTSIQVQASQVSISVTVTPSSFRIPRAAASTQSLFYSFSATPPGDMTLNSPNGVFRAGNNVIGEVNIPLNVSITNGTGRVSEVLNIPVSIVKRAERLGTTRITYVRTFTDTTVSVTAQTEITVTTEAGAEFRITRLQLYFENKRAEITVKRNQPELKAYADIRFTGSGLLQGFWEVDGRILSNVYRHFVYGRTITIETPDIPPLPTFETGTHRVRLVITDPSQDIPFPEAIYFVTAEEFREMFPINLVHPQDNAEIDYSRVTFKWEGKNQTVTYLIEFLEKGGEKPIFSAYTKKAEYKLPLPVLKSIFVPGMSYLWSVKGFDTNNNITGDSQVFRFTFKELTSYLPGQIVMATEGSQKGIELIEEIGHKYDLRLIDKFNIKSLNLKVAVFHTEEEIFRLINAIIKEEGVILAQPNYIFRTMSEPMSDMQNIYKVLNFQKLHKHYKGKGVVVAVIDTGIDTDHRDLKDRVVSSENLLKDYAYKAEVHGTAVAGVIGASINGFGIVGVAPEAEILALRACRQVSETHIEGECYTTSITKAIDIAIENKARIVNMSFGSTSPDKLLIRLIEEGAKRGIIFVAPVGNMPRQKDLTFPASHPDVIAVGGLDDSGNPYPNPEIVSKARVSAPATNVFTTIPRDRHNFLSGTSMSSATVSGIFALAIGKNGAVERDKIPSFNGDICRWMGELLNISICK